MSPHPAGGAPPLTQTRFSWTMCGIAGFWGPPDRRLLEAMAQVQRHRGPDDEGFHESPRASLAFRRLSIIDLAHGAQPMQTPDGRVHIVYNGEVYNYRELRAELRELGHRFATECDTEVVLHAYEEWGTAAFARCNGMWGCALLDTRGDGGRLVLARDHFGIKPLYWARSGDRVLFASEIKALLQDAELHVEPNERVLHEYLTTGVHDHTTDTFFTGIHQVAAATCLVIEGAQTREERYWSPRLSSDGDPDPRRFAELFMRSVERRLIADVPVGTCLSGGLDSSSIVCAMTRLLEQHVPDSASLGDRLKTFSALFDGDPIDEREYIKVVLDATGADNTEIRPTSERFFEELEDFVWHVEEPMVSTGPYAQWCVQREARRQVTVLLDGQGGDELLAGYVPYQWFWLRELARRRRFADLARESWAARDVLGPLVRRRVGERRRGLDIGSLLRRDWTAAMPRVRDTRSTDDLKLRLLQDLTTYSLPSALRYEDRNSMAHSLEARLPFLDQELVDWVLTLPPEAIIRNGWSRWILREGLHGLLPERIRLRRWKVGFTTPEMRWLKARRVILQSVFRSPLFCSRPYWDGERIAEAWRAACAGEVDDSLFFWRALNVEIWLRVYFDQRRRASRSVTAHSTFEHAGDAAVARTTPAAATLMEALRPNCGRHLFAQRAGRAYARAPLPSTLIGSGDDLGAAVAAALDQAARAGAPLAAGDVVAVSEKVVAISQGRSLPVSEIRPSRLAVALSRAVTRTPIGIGLGIPATMQLAIDEVGAPRVIAAAAAAAVTRPLGVRGVFYRVAGPAVAAIDGPTPHTMPPYNTHAKRAPAEPDGVAAGLADMLSRRAGGSVGVAVVDTNDLGAAVLGASPGVDRELLVDLLRDNPMGQEGQGTPFLLVREVR